MNIDWEIDEIWEGAKITFKKQYGNWYYTANMWNEDNEGREHWQVNITRNDLSPVTNPENLIERLETFRGTYSECLEFLKVEGL